MKTRHLLLAMALAMAALLSLCSAAAAAAAAGAPAPAEGAARPAPKLFLRTLPAPKAGDSLTLSARVELPPDFKINSNHPPEEFLVPTRLEVSAPDLEFGPPRYPEPVMEYQPALGGNVPLYSGTFEIRVKLSPKRAPLRPESLRGLQATLHYQACYDNMCWPPRTVAAKLEGEELGK